MTLLHFFIWGARQHGDKTIMAEIYLFGYPFQLDLQLHILFDIIVAHATCWCCCCSYCCTCNTFAGGKRPKKAATCNAPAKALQKMQPAACACINFQLLPLCCSFRLFADFVCRSSNEDMTPKEPNPAPPPHRNFNIYSYTFKNRIFRQRVFCSN